MQTLLFRQKMKIIPYQESFKDSIVDLILNIQTKEFGVPVTIKDQPDLLQISSFYIANKGNFWIAVNDDNEVVGTIALIDFGNNQGALRKMFVKKEYRGKEYGAANALLTTLFDWCKQNTISDVYLGTVEILKASHRFYEKNGFQKINISDLPTSFPRMPVDTIFYHFSFK